MNRMFDIPNINLKEKKNSKKTKGIFVKQFLDGFLLVKQFICVFVNEKTQY